MDVARYMPTTQGLSSKCVLTGSSVYNERIEWLWRDVFTPVIHLYYLFSMQWKGMDVWTL